jgi:hypothetical protein
VRACAMDSAAVAPGSKLHPADTAERAHEQVAPELEAVRAREGVDAQRCVAMERDRMLIGSSRAGGGAVA